MRIRIDNLNKWTRLKEGGAISYPGTRRRTVVLEVNSPDWCQYYVEQKLDQILNNPERITDNEAGREPLLVTEPETRQFIGVCQGRASLEFAVDGPFKLRVEGSETWVYSADGLQVETTVVEPLIYTRIANRKQRNPHLEMMQYQMRLNQEAMARQLEAEVERRVTAAERRLERYAPQRDERAPASLVGRSAGPDRVPPADSAEPAEPGGTPAEEGGAGSGVPAGKPQSGGAANVRGKAGKAAGS